MHALSLRPQPPTELSLPAGLPPLGRGAHSDPSRGVCLMEATALLAGEPHTDRPATVHPALAALARVVNDAVSDAARPTLLPLAPRMIGTAAADPALSGDLVALCSRAALAVALPIWTPRLRRDLRRAERGEPFATRRAAGTVSLAAASLALATHIHRDQGLTRLLSDAVDLAEAHLPHGGPADRCEDRPREDSADVRSCVTC
jgi:hypothetical protein